MMPSAESFGALSNVPAMPPRSRGAVPTKHHVVSRSAPGTRLAPNIANVRAVSHKDRTRAKKVPGAGISKLY